MSEPSKRHNTGGVAAQMQAARSTRPWDDEAFQDDLAALLVTNAEFLKEHAPLLDAKDFKPLPRVRNGIVRQIVAEQALDYFTKHQEPIGRQIRFHALQYANAISLGASKIGQLEAYIQLLQQSSPVPSAIAPQVVAFKSGVRKTAAIDTLVELHASGQLTDEKWRELTDCALIPKPTESDAVASQAQWPELLQAEALYGVAGDLVRAIAPVSEADPAALLFQFLVGFGNLIGRGPHFRVGPTRHYSNLFAVLVGPTSSAGKGMAWSQVENILSGVDGKWAADRVTGGLSSGEGLISLVRDKEVRSSPIKERGIITGYQDEIVDQGVADKRLMVVEQEFANVLHMCFDRTGNSLQQVIRNLWDTGDLNVATKIRQRATAAHGSIIGHITQEELLKLMNSTAMANGFVNRFLWICAKRSKVLARGGALKESVRNALVGRVQEAVAFARNVELMQRTKEASPLWEAEYPALTEERPGLLGKATGRGAPIVMRMACLYALLDGCKLIKTQHLRASLAAWKYCFDSCRFVFGDAAGDPVANEILKGLRNTREKGMSRSDINNYLGHHKSSKEITRALMLLQKQAQAKLVREDGKGRPAERWFAL